MSPQRELIAKRIEEELKSKIEQGDKNLFEEVWQWATPDDVDMCFLGSILYASLRGATVSKTVIYELMSNAIDTVAWEMAGVELGLIVENDE